MLLACGMGCITCCTNCWKCFFRCGRGSKRDPKGGAYYRRLDKSSSQYYKQAEQARSFTHLEEATQIPAPRHQSSSDEISMYDKAPSMKSSTHSHQRIPSHQNLLVPKTHHPRHLKVVEAPHYKHPPRSHTTSRQATVMSRKIRMPTHSAFSRSHHLSHIPSRSHHRAHHVSSTKHHSFQQLPHHSMPHHHHSAAGHSSRRPTPAGYESQLIPKYSRLTSSSRHPLSLQRTPLTSPRNQHIVSHRGHHASSHQSFVKHPTNNSSHYRKGHGPVPWTTVTAATQSTEDRKRRSRPLTPISSPKFEQTSGTQPLRYTTSATGAFNTAEEFYSPNNSVAGIRGKSSDLFLPHIHSGTSNISLSVLPGNGNGYELISLSSSMIGNESEPTPMEAIQ